MSQYARSKVHLGSYSAILQVLPERREAPALARQPCSGTERADLGLIVFDYLHQLCKADRHFVLMLQIRYHSFLYIL